MKRRRGSWSTGPTTVAGRRKASGNGFKHGAASQAFKWAVAYADAVLAALSGSTSRLKFHQGVYFDDFRSN